MNHIRLEDGTIHKPRLRCYSSMNYNEYQDFFGTPPKMPQAPNSKPLQDPLDIPQLSLETNPQQQQVQTVKMPPQKIKYNIETIPQVDSSDANSIGYHVSNPKMDFFQFAHNNAAKMQEQDEDDLMPVKRSRNRPRSYSQNSLFVPKTKILDFLNQSHNRAKKKVKVQ